MPVRKYCTPEEMYEARLRTQRAYRARHREEINAKERAWRREHGDEVRAQDRERYARKKAAGIAAGTWKEYCIKRSQRVMQRRARKRAERAAADGGHE